MIRKAFRMKVQRDQSAEYERRHRPIWPELEATLRAHGVQNYFIYLDEFTGDLFAYAEIASEERWQAIADTDVCRRWWESMRHLMSTHPDGRPRAQDLREVFSLAARTA